MIEIGTKSLGEHSLITLSSPSGLTLSLSDAGAGLYEAKFKGLPLTINDASFEGYLTTDSYFGKTVGRMAGRIKRGHLEFGGAAYQISINEGQNALHGGKLGYSFRKFAYEISQDDEWAEVEFRLVSEDGDMGFPGEVYSRVRYRLHAREPRFQIVFESKAKRPTPLSLTNHSYWNIGGFEDVSGHRLKILASKVMRYDGELLPIDYEEMPPYLDFREGKSLVDALDDEHLLPLKNKGLDHCFLFDEGSSFAPKILLESPKGSLIVSTDFPAVVIYGDNYPHLGRPLTTGHLERPHAGLAIEPQLDPLDIPSMTVSPEKPQKRTIEYRFAYNEREE